MPAHKHPGSLCDRIPGENGLPFLGSTMGSCLLGWSPSAGSTARFACSCGRAGTHGAPPLAKAGPSCHSCSISSHTVFTPPFPLLHRWLVWSRCRGEHSVTGSTPKCHLHCGVLLGRASGAVSLLPVFKANLFSSFLV